MMATGSAKQPMPSMTVSAAMMLPSVVTGTISPPPILASMVAAHHMALGMSPSRSGCTVPSTACMAAAAPSSTPPEMTMQASSARRSLPMTRPMVASAGE